MEIRKAIDNIGNKINEYDQGHIVEYQDPSGEKTLVNKLDISLAKKYIEAEKEEIVLRNTNYIIISVILVLIILVALLIFANIYVDNIYNLTGIYFDKSGTKIELHHNHMSDEFSIKSKKGDMEGFIKKISSTHYGVYVDSNMVAYYDADKNIICWSNDVWKKDN